MHLFPLSMRSWRLNFRSFLAPDHGPALELCNRPVFFQPNNVPDRVLVGLVVGMILFRTPHGLFQDRMREAALDADNDRLVLLVAHHGALQLPFRHLNSPHFFTSAARFWAATVLMRAISRRTSRT